MEVVPHSDATGTSTAVAMQSVVCRRCQGSSHVPTVEDGQYGPIHRTRVPTKTGPLSLFQPTPTKHGDFVKIMQQVLPQLVEDATKGMKRPAETEQGLDHAKSSKTDSEHEVHYGLSMADAQQWWQNLQNGVSHESLIAQYMQKRVQKRFRIARIHH